MIKRTLYFGNPAYLSLRMGQMVINLPDAQGMDDRTGENTVPVEDIGVVLLDHARVTVTQPLLNDLLENNCALITCDASHMPLGMMMNLAGNKTQSERFRNQLEASLPLKKQLWQQTIKAKIENQAAVLQETHGLRPINMLRWAEEVKSGDSTNYEARAAAYYWQNLLPQYPEFRREREGVYPNALLNYGYAILRAIVARALVSSGMLPTFGIHHHNRYNHYCLADDIMEPYRPYVDRVVLSMLKLPPPEETLTKETKIALLSIPTLDVTIDDQRRPLMIAVSQTTASLARCYEGSQRKLIYPSMIKPDS